jgi:hypothetical protein
LADDGAAAPTTLLAAARALEAAGARRVVIAVPMASAAAVARFCEACDEVVCLIEASEREDMRAWYDDFHAVSDAEQSALMRAARWEEIPRAEWAAYLEGFAQRHARWLVRVSQAASDGRLETAEVPLRGLALRAAGERGVEVVFSLQYGDGVLHKHVVHDPRVICIRRANGADIELQIRAAAACAHLAFRSVMPAEMVDGMA